MAETRGEQRVRAAPLPRISPHSFTVRGPLHDVMCAMRITSHRVSSFRFACTQCLMHLLRGLSREPFSCLPCVENLGSARVGVSSHLHSQMHSTPCPYIPSCPPRLEHSHFALPTANVRQAWMTLNEALNIGDFINALYETAMARLLV